MGAWVAGIATQAAPVHLRAGNSTLPTSTHYVDGAPPGFSGGFDENACDACHFEAAPNTAPGSIALTGIPDVFTPGASYDVTVTLDHAEATRGGFQLTARLAETGAQAGTLEAGSGQDTRIKVERQSEIQYASQRREGAVRSNDTFAWVLSWTAPDVPDGTVVQFHAAANAADNDETAEGDFVFTTVVETRAGS